MNVKKIKLADIRVASDRLRDADPSYVAELAGSMADMGQTTPIEVRKADDTIWLTSGLHRLRAAETLNWMSIDASIVECSKDQARLREIEENLMRRELSYLARALCLVERKRLYETEFPHSRRGKYDRETITDTVSVMPVPAFSLNAGELLGVSERTIRRWTNLGEAIDAAAAKLLMGTTLADDRQELDWIAQINRLDQRAAIEAAFDAGKKPSQMVDRLPPADDLHAVERQFSSIRGKMEKTQKLRRQVIEWLYDAGHLDTLIERGPRRRQAA